MLALAIIRHGTPKFLAIYLDGSLERRFAGTTLGKRVGYKGEVGRRGFGGAAGGGLLPVRGSGCSLGRHPPCQRPQEADKGARTELGAQHVFGVKKGEYCVCCLL